MPARTSSQVRLRPAKDSPAAVSLPKHQNQSDFKWGRNADARSIALNVGSLCIVLFCPLMVVYFWGACDKYQCSLSAPISAALSSTLPPLEFWWSFLPSYTVKGIQLYFTWLLFQIILAVALPARTAYGQVTPAGHVLPYKVNGLYAYIITHVLFFLFSMGPQQLRLFEPTIIYDNWEGLLVAANIYGYSLAVFAYIKSFTFPTHPEDVKFSKSFIYDFFMGAELNPRFTDLFDFKLFHNGRPGIVAWTLIDISFAAQQYKTMGYVSNSMILVNLFHAMYVIDFFTYEHWYLKTIDIAHDHFGFYLAWGDSVWLPYMYTIQSHYLVRNPIDLSAPYVLLVLAIGFGGYYIFRAVNNQKDYARAHGDKCIIWGKPAKFVKAVYKTSEGQERSSLLLCSGYWGLSRHFNYVGDLMLSLAMCASCGVQGHLLPYFYIIYMVILLVHRTYRDDARCKGKYGKFWDDYKREVPYAMIPYIW